MTLFHSLFPELAQREVRCIHLLPHADAKPDPNCPDNQFHCIEFFCEDLTCDCRRAFIQITEAGGDQRVIASIKKLDGVYDVTRSSRALNIAR